MISDSIFRASFQILGNDGPLDYNLSKFYEIIPLIHKWWKATIYHSYVPREAAYRNRSSSYCWRSWRPRTSACEHTARHCHGDIFRFHARYAERPQS